MSRTITFLFLILSMFLSVVAQVALEPMMIVSGQNVVREIAGGESHTYQLMLTAGQFVRCRLVPQAVDGTLILTAPDGKQLIEMNLTYIGGQESLSLEVAAAGSYQLTVRGSGATTRRGSYRLEISVQAMATAQDRKRLTAEALMSEANRMVFQIGANDPVVIKLLEPTLVIWHELDEPYWAAWSLRTTGTKYMFLKQYEKAIECHMQALLLSREVKDHNGERMALLGLARASNYLSQYEKVIEYLQQVDAINWEVKDQGLDLGTISLLGDVYFDMSLFEKASEYLEQKLVFIRSLKRGTIGEDLALNKLGVAYNNLSKYEKAIEYFEQALTNSRERGSRNLEAVALNNLGNSYLSLGRYEKAIEYFEQALEIKRAVKDRSEEGLTMDNLGKAYNSLGRGEKAIEYLGQALAISREMKNRRREGISLNNLGSAYNNLSRYEKAIEYLEQALAVNRDVRDRSEEGVALSNLGNAYRGLGKDEKAIEYLEQALAISTEVKNRSEEGIILRLLAQTERRKGNSTKAQQHVEQCLQISESLRTELISPESRGSFLAALQDSYQLYIDLLMRQHQAEPMKGLDALAIEVSERKRARSLLDLLTEARADVRQGVGATLLERERMLGRLLNDRAQRLMQASTPEQVAALKREVSQLESGYERAQAAIRKASPHYAALMQPQPLKLTEMQQQLDADTLLLEYALGPERSYLWAITKDSLASYELPKGELIKQSALQVYELLTARSTIKRSETPSDRRARLAQAEAKLPAAAQALSQQVLGPVAAQLGNKRLVIVADGALQYIPFAMLPEPVVGKDANANRPPTTDHRPPLIVKHEIISLPSASALAIQRTELAGRQPAPKLLAVIADPVFDRADERLKAAATATSGQAQAMSFDDARSIEHLAEKADDKASGTSRKMVIPRLPYTRQEATQLLALTPKNASFSAMDFQANRMTVLDPALSQYRYVHFATHGLADSERPGLSSLVLSTVDAQGKPQDGFLRANDIYNLKLPAELVVLSACQTGLGKDVKGEGLVGLTRGFMYAGAARVVVSLWSVNDHATSDLMTKFYQKMLKQGERPAAALRAAQVEMWKQQQWQSPYYWAAFVIQGEWK